MAYVVLKHFVKPIQINPIKVVSMAQTQGFGDDVILCNPWKPLRDRVSWTPVSMTRVVASS